MTINLKQLITDREAHDTNEWRFASPQRMARLPDLEEAFLEAVGHIEAALDDDRKWRSEAEAFLEKLK